MTKTPIAPRSRPYWRNLIGFALGVLVLGLPAAFYIILPVVYADQRAHPPRTAVCCLDPMDWGISYADVSIPAADGISLEGWYIPSRNGAAVILAHGLYGNRMSLLEQGVFLARHGYGVLLLDLRAHGESGGETITFGGEDILAAAGFLNHRTDVTGKIGVLGYSLGGLQALQAAAETDEIAAVIADGAAPNVFADTPAPDRLLRWLDAPFQRVAFQVWSMMGVTGPLPVTEAVRRIAPRPVLLIAGARSNYEQDMQRKFYESAGAGCSLWEVPEAGHTESWAMRTEEYGERMLALFNPALL